MDRTAKIVAVQDILFQLICLGGGDGDTIREYAIKIVNKLDRMEVPMIRTNDRDTSVKAAERAELKLSSRRVAVLDYALYCGDKGFTDDELKVRYATGAESTYRKRRSELAQHGYLEDSGVRRLNRAGNQEIVWRITDKGRRAR